MSGVRRPTVACLTYASRPRLLEPRHPPPGPHPPAPPRRAGPGPPIIPYNDGGPTMSTFVEAAHRRGPDAEAARQRDRLSRTHPSGAGPQDQQRSLPARHAPQAHRRLGDQPALARQRTAARGARRDRRHGRRRRRRQRDRRGGEPDHPRDGHRLPLDDPPGVLRHRRPGRRPADTRSRKRRSARTRASCAAPRSAATRASAPPRSRSSSPSGPAIYVLQVGDSRYYTFSDGELTQHTRDQTFAQDLVDAGALTTAQAAGSRLKHVLSSAIGGDQTLPVVTRLRGDWRFTHLLCSDGLTKHVSDDQIRDRIASMTSAKQLCEAPLAGCARRRRHGQHHDHRRTGGSRGLSSCDVQGSTPTLSAH